MQSDKRLLDVENLHTLHHFTREVKASGGCRNGAFMFGKDTLETLKVFRFTASSDKARHGRFAKCVKLLTEFLMVAIVKETERTTTTCCVVNYFSHERIVFAKVELVTNTNFTSGIYEHVPKEEVGIQLTEEEHFDYCSRLFLIAVKACGKHLRVVKHKEVVRVKVRDNILKHFVLNLACLAVKHHHATFIAETCGILSNLFFGKFEFEF